MTESLTVPPRRGHATFLDCPLVTDLESLEADIAILGIPYGLPYGPDEAANDQSKAPDAVRRQSRQIVFDMSHYDFDLGGPLLDGRDVRMVDCGNVRGDAFDLHGHYDRAERAARAIFDAGAVLITIGGDHGVPIPVFRALEGKGPITLVHVDAHLDWREEVNGVTEGYSSPIRRASELPWFGDIHQIGLRAIGSARAGEVADAQAYGARLVTAYEVHEHGMQATLDTIPDGGTYYITIDADGFDPTVMPAVAARPPGGLLFHQVRTLLHGVVAKGPVVGMDIVEIQPMRDVNGITALTAGRLIWNLIAAAVRSGQFDRD